MASQNNKKDYEFNFLLDPELSEQEQKNILKDLEEIIINQKGRVTGRDPLVKRSLAYPIDHKLYGYEGVFHFVIEPQNLSGIESKFKYQQKLLRYIITDPTPRRSTKKKPTSTIKKTEKRLERVDETIEKMIKKSL